MKYFTTLLIITAWMAALAEESHKFSHYQHVKTEELECSDCHKKLMAAPNLDINLGVKYQACIKCHDGEDPFKEKKPWHLVDSSYRIPEKADRGNLIFPHKVHQEAKVECATCHGGILEPGFNSAKVLKTAKEKINMKSCMECHIQKAEISCLTCHNKIEKPLDHASAFWLRSEGHGMQSNNMGQDCSQCHDQQTTCADCHVGSDARVVHGLNYRFTHGADVKFKKMDCAVCHQPVNQFCGDCHEGKGR